LEAFWREISWPVDLGPLVKGPMRRLFNISSHAMCLLFGQPGFFALRSVSPLFAIPGTEEALSFYTTEPMRATLLRHVDFDLINSHTTRLSLGATRLRDGQLVFFDNTRGDRIDPAHVLASG